MGTSAKVYMKDGAAEQVVDNGGQITVNAGGTVDLSAGGIILLPTSDPGVAGALWNNAGTPAISAG